MDLFTTQEAKQALLQLIETVMDNSPTGKEINACIKLSGVLAEDVEREVSKLLGPFRDFGTPIV